MNRKQLQSLIFSGVFASTLAGGFVYAKDAAMDSSMPMPPANPDPGAKQSPMDREMPTDRTIKHGANTGDGSMPMPPLR